MSSRRLRWLVGALTVVLAAGTGAALALAQPQPVTVLRPLPPPASPRGQGTSPTMAPQPSVAAVEPRTVKEPAEPEVAPTTATEAPTATTGPVTTIQAFITGYSWFDNTPPGSADISHPVLHQVAAGTGTYDDPITVAVGHSIIGGQDILDWPAGTRFWIPNLRRYFVVEDTCGDGQKPQNGPCHDLTEAEPGAQTWLDIWVGGKGGNSNGADNCMDVLTNVHTVVVNPDRQYEPLVVAGDIYTAAGCATQYGEVIG